METPSIDNSFKLYCKGEKNMEMWGQGRFFKEENY